MGPEDDEVGRDVVGELRNLARRVAAPDVDTDAPSRHADERVGLLPERRAQARCRLFSLVVGGGVVARACRTWSWLLGMRSAMRVAWSSAKAPEVASVSSRPTRTKKGRSPSNESLMVFTS